MGHDCHTQFAIWACCIKIPHWCVGSWLEQKWSPTCIWLFHKCSVTVAHTQASSLQINKLIPLGGIWTMFYLVDRPEHDVQLKLFGHGGATSSVGRVASYKSTTLPSWDLCFISRVRYCQSGQPLCQCNNCTSWDIYDHPKALTYCAQLHGYPTTQMSNLEPPTNRSVNE